MEIYLVGGAVRDELLGLEVKERDWVVVGVLPDDLLAQGYEQVGKDFPVFLHPKTKEEYALARTERKTGFGYTGFDCYFAPEVTLEEDLRRRDLTINAMAKTQAGGLIDPYGGLGDLKQRKLRHVSPAFSEDPLRVLRVARFAARFATLGFQIAPETHDLMSEMVRAGELNFLVPERVWLETRKALAESTPSVYFTVLKSCGALKVLFPEIDALYGVPNPAKWHPEIDSGIHTMMVLDQAVQLSNDVGIRFAALVHDLGKALTPPSEWPSHHGHENSGARLVKQLCERLKTPNDIKDLALLVTRYHGLCHQVETLKESTLLKLLLNLDVLRRPERFKQFLLACEADFKGRIGYENVTFPQASYLTKAAELIRTVDVNAIVKQNHTGKVLIDKIHEARLKTLKESFRNSQK